MGLGGRKKRARDVGKDVVPTALPNARALLHLCVRASPEDESSLQREAAGTVGEGAEPLG